MSLNNLENSDVKVYDIKLTNADNSDTKDIRAQVMTMSIYEDIEEPTVYAEVMMDDQIDLIKKLPIIGEETLEVSFKSPFREEITTYKLKVFNITAKEITNSNKGSGYVLQCVSADHFPGSSINIEKHYKDIVSNMVTDILVNNLKTNKKLYIEPTKGIIEITMPRSSIYKAIDLLRQKAISKKSPMGGVFVFYEDQMGYHFVALETLLDEGKKTIKSRVFKYSPTTTQDEDRVIHNYRNLLNYQQLKRNDTASKISSGVFNNITKSFDMLTKQYGETKFKLLEQSSKVPTGNDKASMPNSPKFLNEYGAKDQFKFFVPQDSSKGKDFISDYFGYKQAFTALFNQTVVRCYAHGDNYLKVGDLVELELPETSGIKTTDKEDPYSTGNYMITKLRHYFYIEEAKFKHRVAFDCNKIGYNL